MKMLNYGVAVLLVLLFSCKQNPENQTNNSIDQLSLNAIIAAPNLGVGELTDQHGQVKVSAAATRISATSNAFATGDKIGLYVVEWEGATGGTQTIGALQSNGNQTDNHLYTYATTGWTATKLPNPLTWRNVSIYAYHPYQATILNSLSLPFSVREDQSSGVVSADYLMMGVGAANATGYTPSTSATPIGLNFTHKTAHVTLKVTMPTTYRGDTIKSIDAAYVLGVPVTGNNLNLSSGALTISTVAANKKPVKMACASGATATSAQFDAVVTAHTIAQAKEVIKIEYNAGLPTSGVLHLYASDIAGFVFEENKHYTLNVTTSEFGFAADMPEFVGEDIVVADFDVMSTKAAVNWTVASGDPTWIKVSSDGGATFVDKTAPTTGNKTYKIQIQENSTGAPRLGKLILSNGTTTEDVEVVVFQKLPIYRWVLVNGLRWAVGNLVGDGTDSGCKIGEPTDCGLYFKFGSLLGWSGGRGTNRDGTGLPTSATGTVALKVKPSTYSVSPTWIASTYLLSGSVPSVDDATTALGDPCRFYLKGSWRLPTAAEMQSSLCFGYAGGADFGAANAAWISDEPYFGTYFNNSGEKLFIPASGWRAGNLGAGTIANALDRVGIWSSTADATSGLRLSAEIKSQALLPQDDFLERRYGLAIRCVQPIP